MEKDDGNVICLDLSLTNSGIAVFNNDEQPIYVCSIPTESKDDYSYRLKVIADKIKYLANEYNPAVACIERGFSRFHASTQALFRVQGVAMLMLYGITQFFYSPSTIKKVLTGRGNASKKMVQNEVLKIYPNLVVGDFDQSDAVACGITYFKKGIPEDE